jgi:hypothetical protein
MMREPSVVVREAAAEQLEERQSDWAYSKPVVILDIVWNFALVVVSATALFLSWNESPEMPLGFGLLDMFCNVFFIWFVFVLSIANEEVMFHWLNLVKRVLGLNMLSETKQPLKDIMMAINGGVIPIPLGFPSRC